MKTRLEVLRDHANGMSSLKHKGWLLDAVERAEKAEAKLAAISKLPEKAEGATSYQRGWVEGWNALHEETKAIIKGDGK